MSVDLAIDFATGDLVATASNDIALRDGADALRQRVHVALMMRKGWVLHPEMGSEVYNSLRSPMPRAKAEVELAIREALAQMGEVTVIDVLVEPSGPSSLKATIKYAPIEQVDDNIVDTLTVTLGAAQ